MEQFLKNGLKNGVQEITFEQLDRLMYFNTRRFWHCYYDVETDKLYNQYCVLVMDNAYNYLLGIGAIDKDKNRLFVFEN